ncbi:hypothetical protein BH10PSE1_BH10PSE1_08900 [soil metagenome]
MSGHDALAESVIVEAGRTFRIPDEMDFETASAFLVTFGTTYHALEHRGRLKPGDTLLVLGAAGGVGSAAVALGKAMGARVVAAVSSQAKGEFAVSVGADAIVIYGRPPFDSAQSRALTEQLKAAVGPHGAQVIYDPVGGDYAEPAIRAIGWEGRYLVVGFTAGIPRLPLNLALLKACDIAGVFWGADTLRRPEAMRAQTQVLFDFWREGRIRPVVSETYSFGDAPLAIARLADGQATGKLVVRVDEALCDRVLTDRPPASRV